MTEILPATRNDHPPAPEPRPALPALRPQGPISQPEWEVLRKIAETVWSTDFVPRGLRGNKAAVMACLLYGREQGLGPMKSLQEVSIIDGQPSESAALMAAKIRAAGHRVWREEIRDDKGAIVAMTAHGRRIDGTEDSFTFSLEMAGRANLLGKSNWKQYPEAMLWARCVSQLARFLFTDVFLGAVYTPEELGAETDASGKPLEGGNGAAGMEPIGGAPLPAPTPEAKPEEKASQEQHALLNALIADLEKVSPVPDDQESWEDFSRRHARERFDVVSRAELTKSQMTELIDEIKARIRDAGAPFS